jgi:ABC-type transport system involved in resistance to organic solvents, permease component
MSIGSTAATSIAFRVPRRARLILHAVGAPVLRGVLEVLFGLGVAFAVLRQAARPINWRRTVRAEFHRILKQAVPETLPTILVTAALIGLVMVYQALYWLQIAGEISRVGRILVLVLVRELAPVLVGLIVLGRCGTVGLVELGAMRQSGQIRRLDALGIDPLIYLVMPRTLAITVATFALTILFIVAALTTGFIAGATLGAVRTTFAQFMDNVIRAMEPQDYLVLPVMSLAIGFAVGFICCFVALNPNQRNTDITTLLPRGFVRAVLAVLFVAGMLTMSF